MLTTKALDPILAPSLESMTASGIRHGFFTRAGGVSEGMFSGLNAGAGSSDRRDHIAENRRRIAAWLGIGPSSLVTLHQVHSPDVVIVGEPIDGARPRADAMVTKRPGLALAILTADCGPVLYADPHARVIGAAHAGWKGALTGILENTVRSMEELGARRDNIFAALGPSISQSNYEVGPEFVERFIASDPASERFFAPSARQSHAMFDLPRYTVSRLTVAGITVAATGQCTYADENLFFSYRRSVHRSEQDYGRQISAIVLEDN